MKIPVSWLREYVDIEQSPEELAHLLTTAGLEVASVESTGDEWDRVYVGEVERIEPHPNADQLVLATVNYGADSLTVATAAPNIAEGQRVAFALEGAMLVDAYAEQPRRKKLKAANIRGVRSEGMVCSERELGLSDEHETILVLPEDAPVGTPLAEYLGDSILELELTTNFSYANCAVGLAREVAAITRCAFRQPFVPALPANEAGTDAEVEGRHVGARYMLQRIDNLTVGASSPGIQARLRASGLPVINNVVDVTNYVMLELGQPMHPFDADAVEGKVIVRAARPGERFETLDHREREMPPGTIMIADQAHAIGIGGIMGGLGSEVSDGTTSILLESARFEPRQIRRSARAMGLRTEASGRFEKGLDPELASVALARAVDLLAQEAGGVPTGGAYDWYPSRELPRPVRLERSEIRRLLGVDIELPEVERILRSLQFEVTTEQDAVVATPPSYRRDVERPADLVEEVGRIWGYDHIPAVLPEGELPPQRTDTEMLIERRSREWLAAAGLQEVINYDLLSAEALAPLAEYADLGSGPTLWKPVDQLLQLRNPLSSEREYLRPSLLPGLLRNVSENLRHTDRVWLYEVDRVFVKRGEELPEEPKRLALVLSGDAHAASPHLPRRQASLFDVKGSVEGLLHSLGIAGHRFMPVQLAGGVSNALGLELNGRCVGYLFDLSPEMLSTLDIERPVSVAELDWAPILEAATLDRQFKPFSRYPAVKQDLAVAVSEHVPAGSIESVIRQHGGRTLREAQLVEVYRGAPLPPGTKSLLYRLSFQAADRSLTEDNASRVRRGIERALREQLGAQIRGVDAP